MEDIRLDLELLIMRFNLCRGGLKGRLCLYCHLNRGPDPVLRLRAAEADEEEREQHADQRAGDCHRARYHLRQNTLFLQNRG